MKTLKEIQKNKHGTHINVFSPGCEERIYVDVDELRAEAIKWVKDRQKNIKRMKNDLGQFEHLLTAFKTQIEWIMYFFNLTEEGLK